MICISCGERAEVGNACPNCGLVSKGNYRIVPERIRLTEVQSVSTELPTPAVVTAQHESVKNDNVLLKYKYVLLFTNAVLIIALIAVTILGAVKRNELKTEYTDLSNRYSQMVEQNHAQSIAYNELDSKYVELEEQLNQAIKESGNDADNTPQEIAGNYYVVLINLKNPIGKEVEIHDSAETDCLPQYSTMSGYRFLGWNTRPDGNGAYIADVLEDLSSDLVLYAIWADPVHFMPNKVDSHKAYDNSIDNSETSNDTSDEVETEDIISNDNDADSDDGNNKADNNPVDSIETNITEPYHYDRLPSTELPYQR